jgi:hypothetical protein
MQKPPLVAERQGDAAGVGGVRKVAPRPTRHQDLDARLAVLLEEQRSPPAVGGARGRKQSGSPGPHNDHIPIRHDEL